MDNIFNYTLAELEQRIVLDGEKKFRASQVFEWLYRHSAKTFEEMNNVGKNSIEYFKKNFSIDALKIEKVQVSSDGTRKYLFELIDGKFVETVLMKHEYGYSVCVSSQVGCNMGCAFCASGINKKERNLEVWEMVLQVKTINDLIKEELSERVSHVVVMGIGEPFDNYDNVLKFVSIINFNKGLEIGSRHITISTCGLVPKIREFADFPLQVNLAISLHFPNDFLRDQYMPINKAYKLDELMDALKYYYDKTNRRITFEYILIDGVNDSLECAFELIKLVRGMNCYINLIPMNETSHDFKRSSEKKMKAFYETLLSRGINVTLRKEQGHDIDAACGQLRIKRMQNTK